MINNGWEKISMVRTCLMSVPQLHFTRTRTRPSTALRTFFKKHHPSKFTPGVHRMMKVSPRGVAVKELWSVLCCWVFWKACTCEVKGSVL